MRLTPLPKLIRFLTAAASLALAPHAGAVNCVVSAAPAPFAMGNYTVLAQVTNNVTITLACTKTASAEGAVTWRLRLDTGSTSGAGGFGNRTMFNGGDALLFNIYTTAAFATIWGDITGGTAQFTGTFNFTAGAAGVGQALSTAQTGFGRIVASQDRNAGNYATTTAITISARVPNAGGGTTYTNTFNSSAVIPQNCLIDSATTLGFGTYDPSSVANVDVNSAMSYRCTKTTPYTISLSTGAGTFASRKMDSAGANTDQLSYNLYTTTGRTIVWGDGTGGTGTVAGTGAGILPAAAVNQSLFGRLFSGQDMTSDIYSDTITITATY